MEAFDNTLTIRRRRGRVAFLADFKNVPTWNDAIVLDEGIAGSG